MIHSVMIMSWAEEVLVFEPELEVEPPVAVPEAAGAPEPVVGVVVELVGAGVSPLTAAAFADIMLPPEQAAELLPWYMQWSRDLAAEMHRRCLVWNEARRTLPSPISYCPCDCASEWRCEPHDACFIHDSCFCLGSGSFPPVKPPRS